ncbi:probable apyrase 7 isoform X1 [Actinidia eriantha]|uniref:probable apyrase 7 isoform X1 n=2 Tax=Actinidia eriantha TaxID=165200 RepID=UPI00258304B4|nr:probable apyrase 7 isoform X1 [Actinidia eriantha]XP_057483439.1 probable apyrase 7 isoform X1 [Actinidia eriantha]
MMFSVIAEILSSAVGRFSAPKSSTLPYVSSGLSPPANSVHGYGFANSGQKNNMRLSSSLQDFYTYRRHDPEGGDLNSGMDEGFIRPTQPNLLQRGNHGSSFSKEKALPGSPLARKKGVHIIMVLMCLLLLPVLVFALHYYYSNWSQGTSKFYVVLDCGSTGTRVYVYQAAVNYKKDGSLPILLRSLPEGLQRKPNSQSGRAYNRMETEPGFDKLVHNAAGLRRAMKPLIRWAEKQIPEHAHKTTSLFLYATAGVRRLPSSDSQWLLNNAWSILKNSPFLCQREWVKIISGMEEAYYGWIALNYHTGVLGAIPAKATFGALDLGGSSLQVTFESKEQVHNETSLKLSIGPVNHHLSAYSLSGYGLNDAFDKSIIHLLKRLPEINNSNLAGGNIEIKHPCLQSGYKEQYFCSQCASIYLDGRSSPIGGKKMGKGGKPRIPIRLIGAPNWEECRELAKVAVNLSEWSDMSPGIDCEVQPCALDNNLPRPSGRFYAMSGFFVVYRFFNLSSDAALDDVLEKGQEFCEKNWEIAKNSVAPQPFIEQYCFRASYIVLLLREGLHITDSQVIIGSGSITWTLGVALLEAGKAFSTRTEFHSYQVLQMKINPVILFAILIVSLFMVICALSCVGNGMPRFFHRLSLFRHNTATSTSVLNMPTPFRFQGWSPVSSGVSGDGRVKMPLSPTVADAQHRPFGTGHGFSSSVLQLTESSLYPSTSSVSHSYSSSSLGQMQLDSSTVSFWPPHRSQMHLQSRRSQSREDLNSSLAEAHLVKV